MLPWRDAGSVMSVPVDVALVCDMYYCQIDEGAAVDPATIALISLLILVGSGALIADAFLRRLRKGGWDR